MRTDTPVLILNCKLGGLAILRSLGSRGIQCWGIDESPSCPGFRSRYSRGRRVVARYDAADEGGYLDEVLRVGRTIGRRALLIPTSDELVMFVARYEQQLEEHFDFPSLPVVLAEALASKLEMGRLAARHGVPVPASYLARGEEELLEAARQFEFPLMLKPCFGSGQNTDARQTMVLVHDQQQLLLEYRHRERPDSPNMMLQEYIPGGDDQVYIFNGYFDRAARCLAAFTGRKIRQYPIHRGCASLGEQCPADEVAEHMKRFLSAIGYQGIVDAGLRLDPRDGEYKLLDVNPRIGQAFRLFLAKDGTDLAECLYLDRTGQPLGDLTPRVGRRWMIEDYDLESCLDYRREGTLGIAEWLRSLQGLQETAWWSPNDPRPFASMAWRTTHRAVSSAWRRLRAGRSGRDDARLRGISNGAAG